MVDSGFNVQIPTCVQLEKNKIEKAKKTKVESINDNISDSEDDMNVQKTKKEKALTTAQTGETRLVTKVNISSLSE